MLFETPISLGLIMAVGLGCAVLAGWSVWRSRGSLPGRYLAGLLVLRLGVVLAVVLLALNPFFVRERPDPDGFRVVLLADVSGSMETADAGGRTRLEVLHELLDGDDPESLLGALRRDFAVEVVPFVDAPLGAGVPLEVVPGTSALGDALVGLLELGEGRGQVPGAVVLLSDGISHRGESLVEAGRRYRAAGVPVSAVGIGSRVPQGDVGLAFQRPPRRAPAGEPLSLPVRVSNSFGQARELEVVLYAGDQTLTRVPAVVPAGGEVEVMLETMPELPGFETYRVRLAEPLPDDTNPVNDQAYAAVEITPPETLEVLYLGNRVGNNFRFLQGLARQGGALDLRAVIRTGEDRYFVQGLEGMEETGGGFPVQPGPYLKNRVLVVEAGVLAELDEGAREAIRGFLEDRAGGVLFLGSPGAVPDSMRSLLPVREAELILPVRREPLELMPDPVFREAVGGVLFMPPGLFLAEDLPTGVGGAVSRGARVAGATRHGTLPVLAVQAYGAGRTAWLGTEGTWRWRMESARSAEQYPLFWMSLLGWLGAGGKPRLETPVQASVQVTGEPVVLDVRVLGRDFRPAVDARVEAVVTGPDGLRQAPVTLVPGPYEVGHFAGAAVLPEPGEYRVDYRVVLPDGEELTRRVFLVGMRQGREYEDTVFREEPLLDLTRMTGGRYARYTQAENILPLSLVSGLPVLEESIFWTRLPLFLVILLTLASLEWLLRRRVGLR